MVTVPDGWGWKDVCYSADRNEHFGDSLALHSPYGIAGKDSLWVRETWTPVDFEGWPLERHEKVREPTEEQLRLGMCIDRWIVHRATASPSWQEDKCWRPSIFMPKWACRLRLDLLQVRAERLQDISDEDIKAEGVRTEPGDWAWRLGGEFGTGPEWACPRQAFKHGWDSINKKRGFGWAMNPWVWKLTFNRQDS